MPRRLKSPFQANPPATRHLQLDVQLEEFAFEATVKVVQQSHRLQEFAGENTSFEHTAALVSCTRPEWCDDPEVRKGWTGLSRLFFVRGHRTSADDQVIQVPRAHVIRILETVERYNDQYGSPGYAQQARTQRFWLLKRFPDLHATRGECRADDPMPDTGPVEARDPWKAETIERRELQLGITVVPNAVAYDVHVAHQSHRGSEFADDDCFTHGNVTLRSSGGPEWTTDGTRRGFLEPRILFVRGLMNRSDTRAVRLTPDELLDVLDAVVAYNVQHGAQREFIEHAKLQRSNVRGDRDGTRRRAAEQALEPTPVGSVIDQVLDSFFTPRCAYTLWTRLPVIADMPQEPSDDVLDAHTEADAATALWGEECAAARAAAWARFQRTQRAMPRCDQGGELAFIWLPKTRCNPLGWQLHVGCKRCGDLEEPERYTDLGA